MQDIPDLLDGLRRAVSILSAFVRSVPPDQLNLRRGEGFWTIGEHLAHLAEVQPMLLERMQRFRDEARPEFIPYIPGEDNVEEKPPQMAIGNALTSFEQYRSEQLELLEKVDAAVWRKTATHPEYEHYSLYILARHVLMHDFRHMYRMEELWLTRNAYLTKWE